MRNKRAHPSTLKAYKELVGSLHLILLGGENHHFRHCSYRNNCHISLVEKSSIKRR